MAVPTSRAVAWPALWRHLVPRRRWPHTAPHASSSARSHARFFGTHSRAVAETRGAAAEGGQSDWRAWFRSADYDDAYGPYSGFREGDAEAEAPSASGAGAGAWDGTWRRRRHGLNLEPLRLIAPRGAEEEDVDGDDAVIANGRRRAAWADAQTRFLCRMLDVSDPASGGGARWEIPQILAILARILLVAVRLVIASRGRRRPDLARTCAGRGSAGRRIGRGRNGATG